MAKKSKIITLGGSKFLVVDLTKTFTLDIEVYPGDPKPVRKIFTDIEKDCCHHYIHEFADHHFQPHADAPNHQNIELQHLGIETFGLDYVFNSAFMIDLSGKKEAAEINGIKIFKEIKKEHLTPFNDQFSTKGAVVIRTGYDIWLENNLPHKLELIPYLTAEAAEYIASFENIKVVALDSISVDHPDTNVSHKILKEKMIVESMVNLYGIPENARLDFDLETAPLKIKGATGSPVSAFAFIKINE